MKNILIVGATGSLGQKLIQQFKDDNVHLTLLSRHAKEFESETSNVNSIDADILNNDTSKYFKNQDEVFVALSGDLPKMASKIIQAMDEYEVRKLVFIASMGIYNEIPSPIGSSGNLNHNPFLNPYRKAADLIEQSDLNYTILRPGWFDEGNNNFELTNKNEPFGGHNVSRAAITKYAKKLLLNDTLQVRANLGINRPS